MAGHSKFKNIQYRKGAQDKKRARLFSRLAREITVAARAGLPEINSNPRLRAAVQTARAANMPTANIERAIRKSTETSENFTEARYEGFGPGGIGVIVEVFTNNKNRTASELRSVFSRHSGTLGELGAVSFMFQHTGELLYPSTAGAEDTVLEAAVDAGAHDCITHTQGYEIICAPEDIHKLSQALEKTLGEPHSVGLVWKPKDLVNPSNPQALVKLLDALEDNEDVREAYTNCDMEALSHAHTGD